MKGASPKNRDDLTADPVGRLIIRLTVPAGLGLFFYTMFNVVDTWFAGLISTQALAAMSLSLPVYFVIISMGRGVSIGSTALVGNALGAKDKALARRYSAQSLVFGFFASAVMTLIGWWAAPYLFRLLGAEDDYLIYCLEYTHVLLAGTWLIMLVFMLNAVLNADGDTKSHRNFLIGASIANLGLDPWFLYGGLGIPAMGLSGIALSTVLVQVGGGVYLGVKVRQTGILAGAGPRDFLPDPAAFAQIMRQGIPAGLNIATIALGTFIITYFISSFGKSAVAAYGAAMRVEQILLMPAIGLNVAVLSIVAQNFGAKRFDRVSETVFLALKYGAVVTALGTGVVLVFARFFMEIFTNDAQVVRIGVQYLRIDALTFFAYVLLFVCTAALQGIKRPMFAVVIGLYRQIAAPMCVFFLFARVLGWGLLGIWLGILTVTWSAAGITWYYWKRMEKNRQG